MRSADRRRGLPATVLLLAVLLLPCLGAPAAASPVRVATLGGDGLLLLDSTNLFTFPALAGELAHADVELFDDWAGAAVRLGPRHAVGLFLNRPDAAQAELQGYLAASGQRLLASLSPRPWVDALYALRLRPGLSLGIAGRTLYDVRDLGADEAEVSRQDLRLGAVLGAPGERRLDVALAWENTDLRSRVRGLSRGATDGTGLAVDLRARWPVGGDGLLLPSLRWRRSAWGLAPEEHRIDEARAGVALNLRPTPTVLALAGVVVARQLERWDVPGDAQTAQRHTTWLLPAVIAGGEVQVGGLVVRLGVRHETVVDEAEGPAAVDMSFDGRFAASVGLGFEAGHFALDGQLENDFLRDGPHFLGGSSRGGGLLSTMSLVYRLYP